MKQYKQKNKYFSFDTYMAMIKNSVGSRMFRNFYMESDGVKKDILKNGDLSCAFFVSNILYIFKLINSSHCTVDGTIRDLEKSSWRKIKKPKIGSVLVWEEKMQGKNKESHRHIGFYIGANKDSPYRPMAISNSSKKRTPVIHHWTFGAQKSKTYRKIERVYWHKGLGEIKSVK